MLDVFNNKTCDRCKSNSYYETTEDGEELCKSCFKEQVRTTCAECGNELSEDEIKLECEECENCSFHNS